MSGFGKQPAGTSPYGLGTPAVAPVPGGVVLRNELTGRSEGGRYIDPITKDYTFDDHGRLLGMPNVRQMVQLALSTTRGTSAVKDLGNELSKVDRITANVERRVRDICTLATRHLIDARLIEVVSVTTERAKATALRIRFKYRDLTTSEEEEVIV